ncbi:Uncharacterised protein [uncultured archaeon]|nr:Uncharacterised protein [uncultured archaeon]
MVTNLEQAHAQNFDVTMLPARATELIETVRANHAATERLTAEFIHEITVGAHTFQLHCLCVSRRPGVIAPVMKAAKLARKL